MRKKGCLLLAALALLLAGCGEKTQKSAEDLQARYAQMQGYEAIVETAVPREDETGGRLRFSCVYCAASPSIRTSFSMRNGGVVSCPQPVSYFAMR